MFEQAPVSGLAITCMKTVLEHGSFYIIPFILTGFICQKFHAESLPGKKVKLALLKQILVAAAESLLQDRHSHEYANGGIWAAALLAFREQRLEYLFVNLSCHEAIELVMPCVGVRILL